MAAFLLGVLAAAFVGSLHCVGMCGPLLALTCAGEESRWWNGGVYQLGRLVALLLVGLLAGALGTGLDAIADVAGLQRTAAVIGGVLVIGWGLFSLARGAGWHVRLPERLQERLNDAVRWASGFSGAKGALLIGLATPLLPCGWLYLFVFAAAGTGHPGWGAATLAAFWAGTTPAMLGAALGLAGVFRSARRAVPIVTGVLLVGVGTLLIVQRSDLPLPPVRATVQPAATEVPATPVQSEAPCCAPR